VEDLSAVLLLQRILNDALDGKCSDVHLLSGSDEFTVQFRASGQLRPYLKLTDSGQNVIRRIKALAKMDVSESRYPQDGAFTWQSEASQCDVRVASIPTVYGEAVVLRIFSKDRGPLTFTSLGMNLEQSRHLHTLLENTSGMCYIAGLYGGGRHPPLYSM